MNDDFATAMRRALDQTRAGDPMEATRLIQSALNGSGVQGAEPRRRPLGQVIDSLANGQRIRPQTGRSRAMPEVPEGARYERRRHDCAFGGRDYRLFVPSERDEGIAGVVVMLHGCTQDADDFAAGTRMNLLGERHNLVVIYPEQPRGANQMGCWNWFRPGDQAHGRGEPALIADLASATAREFGAPEGKIFAAGLSAGGAMAAILGAAYPDVFTAVGVHSGLAPGSASDIPGAYAAMRGQAHPTPRPTGAARPTIVFHGTSDQTVAPTNADSVIAAALGGTSVTAIEDGSASGATCTLYRDERGRPLAEDWRLNGVGHAWSGGAAAGSYTHPAGPDASAEMVRFFLSVAAEGRT